MANQEAIKYYQEHLKGREGAEDFIKYLVEETDFFDAPASTRFHGSFEGGLALHSINVRERLFEEVSREKGKDFALENILSLNVISLFHDVCKANFYVKGYKAQKCYDENKVNGAPAYAVKKDARGQFIWEDKVVYEIDDKFPYGHGEKSVYIITKYMKLTDEEALAIRWHMGSFDDSVKSGYRIDGVYKKCPLALLLHIADMKSTHLDEVIE